MKISEEQLRLIIREAIQEMKLGVASSQGHGLGPGEKFGESEPVSDESDVSEEDLDTLRQMLRQITVSAFEPDSETVQRQKDWVSSGQDWSGMFNDSKPKKKSAKATVKEVREMIRSALTAHIK